MGTDIDLFQLKLLHKQAVRDKTINDRVLSLRDVYDAPSISSGELLHCPKPSATEFELVRAFYKEHHLGKRACGKILRRMLIPFLEKCPNAYRICKSSTDYFIWDGKKFVLNIDLFMFTDPRKTQYNDMRFLMASLQDGSFFWLGDYEPKEGERDIVPRMRALAKTFEVEAGKDHIEPLMLASISEEYCRYVREAKKICAELKIRLNNVQTVLAAMKEMEAIGLSGKTGIVFDLRSANKKTDMQIFEQMQEFGSADTDKFNEFADCISQTFVEAFGSAECAKYGLIDCPIADDLNLTPISEPIPASDIEKSPPRQPSSACSTDLLRCDLAGNQPYDYWDDTIEVLSNMIDMPGYIPEFDDVFEKHLVGEAQKVICRLCLDKEVDKRELEKIASMPVIPTKENTARFRAVEANKVPESNRKRKRKNSGAVWY